jgi:amino acid transporter
VKLCIILLVIAVGVFYIDFDNWTPFAPNGVSGVLKGVSAVFFAYIGFDAISTAEECENPQRFQGYDVGYYNLYRLVHHNSIVLTGMVIIQIECDPLLYVFEN